MDPRKFAMFGGIVMLLMGVFSLIMPGSLDTLPILKVENSYGLFLGLFPMNILNKIALIVFGLMGIAAASSKFTALPLSIKYSRLVMVFMGVAAILGLIPATSTLFGYWPLFGYEVAAHGIFAIIGAYFGFALTSKVPKVHKPAHGASHVG